MRAPALRLLDRVPGSSLLVLVLFLVASTPLRGQETAPDDEGISTVHPSLATTLAATRIAGRPRAAFGIWAGLRMDDRYFVSGGGVALLRSVPAGDSGADSGVELDVGYGGVMAGYVLWPAAPWSVSGRLLAGAGHATATNRLLAAEVGADNFLLLEPALSLRWHPTGVVGVSLGAAFRLSAGVDDLPGVDGGDLGGPSVYLGVQLGR